MIRLLLLLMVIPTFVLAHEMTPTYPELRQSHVNGVLVTSMTIFNRRSDVEFYEIQVFSEDWKPMPFAAIERIMKVEYLQTKTFDLYLRDSDIDNIMYVCTLSKLKKDSIEATAVASKICSKIK